jgi:outer membrane protein assembly factor BamA
LGEFNLHINGIRGWLFLSLTVSAIFLFSCNPTKYVPEGESLLDENHLKVSTEGVKPADLEPYLKQKPNKKIFGSRFHLGLYNLSNINKEKGIHKWLREIGEEPVIFDSYATTKSVGQIKSYVSSKGYFDGKVSDTVETSNRKSSVYYKVDITTPYTIRNVTYKIADSNLLRLYCFDSINNVIERGKPYDVDILQMERLRFERLVRDQGFYQFSSEYITFAVDSTIGNRQVDVNFIVKNFSKIDENSNITLVPHSIYKINNIYIYPDFIPRDALEEGDAYFKDLDTTFYRGYYFIGTEKKPEIKYDFIIQSLYLKPGATYNLTNTEQSQTHLIGSKVFRLVNIAFIELRDSSDNTDAVKSINCIINLTMLSKQSYKVELEGTNSGGSLGGAVNLIYQHKNLFHGAEIFSMKLKAAYEALKQENSKLESTQDYGIETGLRLPNFLMPFIEKEAFIKKYNPTTNIIASYNYQSMPFYNRTMANATFGYNWKANTYQEHFVNPLQFNILKLPFIDSTFKQQIETSSYMAYAYQDVLILGGNYSYIYNNQSIKKSRDYWFLRINAESSGNMLSLLSKLTGATKKDSAYYFLNQPFAQYVRGDIDLRYNYTINEAASMVYRGFFGIGIPYGNSKAIPFEKQYFGGGANGVRGWQVRTLGPGSYVPDTTFLNQTADIKLELNTEYRFKLFWILEGALFVDAGNIWYLKEDPNRPGSQFKISTFYKDIAVGAGTGIRFDFEFFLARIDLGIKLRDPSIQDENKWVIMNRSYKRSDFAAFISIGYPF